ncbi:transposase [Candidatus Brocadia sapporoensis]|uniref:Transposase n=1 Tax=Candidatus Brocadia sapporoensis TaxID=392547 RepID=A0A1V6M3L1_9BACT|nr:IS4 family transposase [Candidatus Brocadia sapporoensis]MDG6004389.1 IS4 family transposase [Candidatus Brocadia sp.]OQD46967.1 transposase [Candidatus Brocadia sapporoensis]GJQ24518.1 MAG: IS4 family transposase [Candidatus Brocadia sapporoensis]
MNKFCSIFSQLLQLFPRSEFYRAVKETNAEYHARGFSCWEQFVSMLFCQLGRAHSLREITGGLRSCEGKLTHLGITAPSRSTLAYANEHRPWQLYQKVFLNLMDQCRDKFSGKKKFKFKNKLVSLDSSTIDLSLSLFDWAKFRRTKGAVKLHLILDHDGYLPSFAVITEDNVSDVKVAHQLHFDPGTIVVDDRGYNDYSLFGKWTAQGVFFVTRMKNNTLYEVVKEQEIPKNSHILKDEIIHLTGTQADEKCPHPLRRIEVYNPEKDEVLVFLTNNMKLSATTIAAIYKDRWQIELFFKALKQNLKIKTFVGTSANAVKIQIWTALIAMVILKYLQLSSKFAWSLSNLVALLRMNLFTHRDIWAWLDKPFDIPPIPYEPRQLSFNFS